MPWLIGSVIRYTRHCDTSYMWQPLWVFVKVVVALCLHFIVFYFHSHSFNRIDIPPYESYEKLYEKLLTAVEETCGFAVEWTPPHPPNPTPTSLHSDQRWLTYLTAASFKHPKLPSLLPTRHPTPSPPLWRTRLPHPHPQPGWGSHWSDSATYGLLGRKPLPRGAELNSPSGAPF